MKKVIKIAKKIFLGLLSLMAVAVFFGYVFEDDIVSFFKREASKQLNATVDARVRFSVWKDLPNVSIELENPVILDAIKGSKDTLLKADEVFLSFDIFKLLRKEFVINQISVIGGDIYLKIDEQGNNNYTILKSKSDTTKKASMSLELEKIILQQVHIHYINQSVANNHEFDVHYAEADLLLNDSLVNISLAGEMYIDHIRVGEQEFIDEKEIKLNASCQYVFNQNIFVLGKSDVQVNGADFSVDGKVKSKDKYIDFAFEAKKNSIKNIVALLPKHVADELGAYNSEGQVTFIGQVKGEYGKQSSPEIVVQFGCENTSIYHPVTHKKITDVYMKGEYSNGSKHQSSTSYVKIFGLKGKLDGNNFKANIRVEDFNNPYLTLDLQANVSVKSLLDFYPIEGLNVSAGKLALDLDFKGRIYHLKSKDFLNKVKSKGSLQLDGLSFRTSINKLAYKNFTGKCIFNNNNLGVTGLRGQIGKSNFKTSGFFRHFFSYLLLDRHLLEIQADFESDFLDLDELLAVGDKSTEKSEVKYKFSLDQKLVAACNIKVKQLKFRKFKGKDIAKDLKGEIFIKHGKIRYKDVSGKIAEGQVVLNGEIDASKTNQVLVNNHVSFKQLNVSKALFLLENFGQTFLTDKNLKGDLTAGVNLFLSFDQHLKLDLSRLESTIKMEISNGELKDFEQLEELGKVLAKYKLTKYLKSQNLNYIKFDKLSNTIFIKKEVIMIPQMQIGTSASSDITLNGTHQFNNKFDYNMSFPLVNYKRQNRRIDRGIAPNGNDNKLHVFVKVYGTPDNYKVDYDEKAILKSVSKQVLPDFKLENVFKKDTLPDVGHYLEVDTTELIFLDDF